MAAVAMDVEEADTQKDLLEAMEITQPQNAMKAYRDIVCSTEDDTTVEKKESAVLRLAALYEKLNCATEFGALIGDVRPLLSVLSKARGAKLFRDLLDRYLAIEKDTAAREAKCRDCIEWTKDEKRVFLRQALEGRLIALYLEGRNFQRALALTAPLLKELKRLDDKAQLVEVQLMESQAYFALSNYPKARGALTTARTTANSIYCPALMQANLDLQSGVLHAQEGDFKTGYSYFYESFEGYDSINKNETALTALKYMLLSKVMLLAPEDVPSIMSGKLALKYTSRSLEAMQAIARACEHRALEEFEQAKKDFADVLADDVIVQGHLSQVHDELLISNLSRIVEPYSRVEIACIADLIKLPTALVESKLSQMILDQKLDGILDQRSGCLEIFEARAPDQTYEAALATVEETGKVVESLYKKAQKLF